MTRLATVAACVVAILLLQIVPSGDVLVALGILLAAVLLVVDIPRAWQAICRH